MSLDREPLERALGYVFKCPELLERALTHRSYGRQHNERLEFLGDGLLNMVVARALYGRLPDLDEGDLSRLRASLVRRETLAEVAEEIGLGAFIRLGASARKSGGLRSGSILADALEAVFGAVLLDAGVEVAAQVVEGCFEKRLNDLPPAATLKDPKTKLQEHLQGRGKPLPSYALLEVGGASHRQYFRVACHVDGYPEPFVGEGRSRRRAEQHSAALALAALNEG